MACKSMRTQSWAAGLDWSTLQSPRGRSLKPLGWSWAVRSVKVSAYYPFCHVLRTPSPSSSWAWHPGPPWALCQRLCPSGDLAALHVTCGLLWPGPIFLLSLALISVFKSAFLP